MGPVDESSPCNINGMQAAPCLGAVSISCSRKLQSCPRSPKLLLTLALLVSVPAHARQAPASGQGGAEAREANLRSYVELLRSDVRTQKVAIITEMMQFSEAEDAKFWPIYREYEVELAAINDDRIALVVDYAAAYGKMSDAEADRIAASALDLEARRHALKVKYYTRLKAVLPVVTAVRFLQVENQLLLLLDLQIAASLPVVK